MTKYARKLVNLLAHKVKLKEKHCRLHKLTQKTDSLHDTS